MLSAIQQRLFDTLSTRAQPARPLFSPVAVVGMGCRFPGEADTPGRFFSNLCAGKDPICPVPPQRKAWTDIGEYIKNFPEASGIDKGGFLQDIDAFDPYFFSIVPAEASHMDPRQRLCLEVALDAIEDSGMKPSGLRGKRVGVFMGAMGSSDYLSLMTKENIPPNVYTGTGNESSILANRISYVFNFTGPSITVDTACSSSLAALHYANMSLMNGECDIALAGGVNLLLDPFMSIALSKLHFISKDSRCKTFDASANGFIRSEGCGIVVLKRRQDAETEQDRIYAWIIGSAVNQDGATNGLTAPNGLSQQAVISDACRRAGISPGDLSFIETHGTGTILGDPIEVDALKAIIDPAISRGRTCTLGAVKSNIGHCEAAAGIAGFIKLVLCLHHQRIPGNLHLSDVNPHIAIGSSALKLARSTQKWEDQGRPRRGGVSSFGFGGTNAHVIAEENPRSVREKQGPGRRRCIFISAHTETACKKRGSDIAEFINENPSVSLDDLAFTLLFKRERRSVAAVAVAAGTAKGNPAFTLSGAEPLPQKPAQPVNRCVFMFPGQGSQYVGMGKTLYAEDEGFKADVDCCADFLRPVMGLDIRDILYPAPSDEADADKRLRLTKFSQPALFITEYALARWWMNLGIAPDLFVGHSIGEFVAAALAGVFSLDECLRLVARRGALMQELPAGAMASVRLSADKVAKRLPDGLSIATINSPVLCVVSGPFQVLEDFCKSCEQDNIPVKPLFTSHAFHSAMMDGAIGPFCDEVKACTLHEPEITVMSTVTGKLLTGQEATDPQYWARHMRVTVRFSDAIGSLLTDERSLFLEIGPRATLTTLARQHLKPDEFRWIAPSLAGRYADDAEWRQLFTAMGWCIQAGIPLAPEKLFPTRQSELVSLPAYPFTRTRYWFDDEKNQSMPVNPKEQKEAGLVPAIQEILHRMSGIPVGQLSPDAPFLHLGFDSLLLTQFANRLKDVYQTPFSFQELSQNYTTIRKCAQGIEEKSPAAAVAVRKEHPGHPAPKQGKKDIAWEEGVV